VIWVEAERARCPRALSRPDEVAGLEALGDELRQLRWNVAGLARLALAVRAEISVRQIEQIERAIRRTRRSTLERIASALVNVKPDLGDPAALVSRLSSLAGSGLAPESEYRERVEKRRKARWKRMERRVLYRYIMPMLHAQLDAELREERRVARELR
jgi:transcriptional regulator with XRE-family HTH domain